MVDIDKLDMTFITIYRPPPPNSSLSKFKDILNQTRQHIASNISKGKDYNITVAGDFNFPPTIVSWVVSDDSVFADPRNGISEEKIAFQLLHELAIELNMDQIVTKPTRGRNTLDLIFTDAPGFYCACTVKPHPDSDHKLISCKLDMSNTCNHPSLACHPSSDPEIASGLHPELIRLLNNTNWENLFTDPSQIESANQIWLETLTRLSKMARIPKFNTGRTPNRYEREIIHLTNKKVSLENILLTPDLRHADRASFTTEINTIGTKIQKLIIDKQQEEENRVIEQIKVNSKQFFSFANDKRISRNKIGPLNHPDGSEESSPPAMANILSDQFISVFTTPAVDLSFLVIPIIISIPTQEDINFSETDMVEAIKEIKNDSSPGPDTIPAIFYKLYAEHLAKPIYLIWRLSLDTGKLPEGKATSVITPTFRGVKKAFLLTTDRLHSPTTSPKYLSESSGNTLSIILRRTLS